MPTYEFRCPSGHDFEKFYRSIGSAPTEVRCPTCEKVAARQMSAGGGLVFKGSGFYITDYGKDGKKSQTPPVKAVEGATARTTAEAGASSSEGAATGGSSPAPSKAPSGESKAPAEAKPVTPAPVKKPKTGE